MSTQKHTPGPWIANADGRSIEAKTNGVLPLTTICIFPNPTFPQDAANARLIAAAPELLDCLKDFIEYHLMIGNSEKSSKVLDRKSTRLNSSH